MERHGLQGAWVSCREQTRGCKDHRWAIGADGGCREQQQLCGPHVGCRHHTVLQ